MYPSVTLVTSSETQSFKKVAILAGLLGTASSLAPIAPPHLPYQKPGIIYEQTSSPTYSFSISFQGPESFGEKIALIREAYESIKSSQTNLDSEIESLVSKNFFDLI